MNSQLKQTHKKAVKFALALLLALPLAAQYFPPPGNGTPGPSGLLSGTLAAIPATCTAGVSLYQATDQPTGLQLEACTSTNTWTRIPYGQGASNPATCSVGQWFFNTAATAGQNIELCTSTNTWTAVVGGSLTAGFGIGISGGVISAQTPQLASGNLIQNNQYLFCDSTTGTTAYACTPSAQTLAAYMSGQAFLLRTDTPCTTTATLNIGTGGGLGSTSLDQIDGVTACNGQVAAHQPYWVFYDGTVFRIMGGASGSSTPSFPQTVGGTAISGGAPCFTSTTQMSSSALFVLNHVLLGGGVGACPTSDANLDDGATTPNTLTYAGGGGIDATQGPITTASKLSAGPSPPAVTPGTGYGFACTEGTNPSAGAASGVDLVVCNSAAHGLVGNFNNNGSYLRIPNDAGISSVLAQSTSQSTVTIATAPGAGDYQITYYADLNTPCTTGSNSVTFTFNWTDASNARILTTSSLALAAAQTTTSYVSGMIPLHVASGNVTYTSTVTGTCSTGTSSYDINAELVRVN